MGPLDSLLEYFNQIETGRVILGPGEYHWHIRTKSQPSVIWLTAVPDSSIPVCQGDVNSYSASPVEDGFILHAYITTDREEILWQAFLGAEDAGLDLGVV
jgi:hypothetical protein